MNTIFGLKASIVLVVAILAMMNVAATTAYAKHHSDSNNSDHKSSNSKSNNDNSKSSDSTGSSSKTSDNTPPQPSTLAGGDTNNVQPGIPTTPPSTAPSGSNEGPTSATPPNPSNVCIKDNCPKQPPPNISPSPQCTGNDVTKCPTPPGENLGINCPQGATVVSGHCVVQGPPLPNGTKPTPTPKPTPQCPGPVLPNGQCLPKNCHVVDTNGTNIVCVIHRTINHSSTVTHNTIQQVPVLAGTANLNNINIFIVTQCIADFDLGAIKGTTATLCDTSIAMMHAQGLDAQIPSIDTYLKARNLL